jgi:transcriptional regulator GlxA family with amidase domain
MGIASLSRLAASRRFLTSTDLSFQSTTKASGIEAASSLSHSFAVSQPPHE